MNSDIMGKLPGKDATKYRRDYSVGSQHECDLNQ